MTKITLFIHGTFPHNLFPNPLSAFSEKILYKYFHCPTGLHKVTDLDPELHIRAMMETIAQQEPQEFPLDTFYTFGWLGELDAQQRKNAAHDVYAALETLAHHYDNPEITIITHSHGGNVALNLAAAAPEGKPSFSVERLILLACPVQQETAAYAHNALFKNVYSLHSHTDMLQVGDPQGLQHFLDTVGSVWKNMSLAPLAHITLTPFFSERHFTPAPTIHHVVVKMGNRHIFHFEFLYLKFMEALPGIIATVQDIQPTAQEEELVVEID